MGLTYFKLKSPYAGDLTKFCSLNGIEIDRNFLTLEGLDIMKIQFDGEDLIFTRKNGEQLKAPVGASCDMVITKYQELDRVTSEDAILPCSLKSGVSKIYRYIKVDPAEYEGITFNFANPVPEDVTVESKLYVTDGTDYYRRSDFDNGSIFILEGQTNPQVPQAEKLYFYEGKFYQYFKSSEGTNKYYYGQAVIADGMELRRALEMLEQMAYGVDAGFYD